MSGRKRVIVRCVIETTHMFDEDEIEGLDHDEIMELVNARPAEAPDHIEEFVHEVEDE